MNLLDPKRLVLQPYHWFLVAALAVIAGAFMVPPYTVDLYFHDTYFIIYSSHVFGILSILLLAVWGLYLLVHIALWYRWLTWMHVIITLLILVLLLTGDLLYPNNLTLTDGEPTSRRAILLEVERLSSVYIFMTWLFWAGQLAFLINVFGGLIIKRHDARKLAGSIGANT